MKKLFESADVYLSRSDWKDLALIKFCLFGMGLLVGSSVGAKARRPAAFAGLALFIFLVTYQSLFIHEIRIDGFSRLTETEIRTALAEAGLYEGCRKTVDPNRVAVQMYRVLDNIAYCGIKYEGGLAQVYISERTQLPEKLDTSQYCHVVANKSGYIQKVTAKGGSPAVSADQYVEAGDILISGAYKVQDTTFESTGDGRLVYAHAMGEVLARVPYRFTIYLDRYDMAQSETGRQAPGFALTLGTQTFRTDSLFRPYDTAVTTEHPIITVSRPFPFRLSAVFSHEVASERVEKSQEELLSLAEMQLRLWAKKNLPENGEILNKDLKFTPKDNIIEVTIMLEVLEDIGREQVFIPAKAEPAAQEPPPTM
ncbi:MAG: sporulation protein YqfD [Firmicutes bacterium]|nr:sporulation protein YqfD [Bacillota bacterium]